MAIETWSPQSSALGVPQKPEGSGWQLTGYNTVRINNPKMGSGYSTKQIPIYTRQSAPPPPPAPAPASAPAPKPAKAPSAPTPSAESTRYRDEAANYMKQAQDMLNQFKIEQQRAAEAARLAEEMRIKSQASLAANMARSQQTPNLQIQPASGTPQTAGTQAFKRRRGDTLTTTPGGLSALNIASPSTLNV